MWGGENVKAYNQKRFEGADGSLEFEVYEVTENIEGIPKEKKYLLNINLNRPGVSHSGSKVYKNLDFLELIEKDVEMLGFKEV